MDLIFEDFRNAYSVGKGYELAQTLSPEPPPSQPDRLYNFFRSTNFAAVKNDFRYRILYDNTSPFKLPADEGNGWVEIYVAYWKAIGEILNAENAPKANAKVKLFLQNVTEYWVGDFKAFLFSSSLPSNIQWHFIASSHNVT